MKSTLRAVSTSSISYRLMTSCATRSTVILLRPALTIRWLTAFCMNSNKVAAFHQFSSFLGNSSTFRVVVLLFPDCHFPDVDFPVVAGAGEASFTGDILSGLVFVKRPFCCDSRASNSFYAILACCTLAVQNDPHEIATLVSYTGMLSSRQCHVLAPESSQEENRGALRISV